MTTNGSGDSASAAGDSISGMDVFDVMSSIDVPAGAPSTFTPSEKVEAPGDTEVEVEVESPDGEADGGEAAKESEAVSLPSLKAKVGEAELEVPEIAVFTVKVDNKDEIVTAKDLIRNYQQKVPYEKAVAANRQKETELSVRENTFANNLKIVDEKLEDVLTTYEENPYLALCKIAELKGKNPADYLPLFIAQSKATVAQLEQLSDAEFKALLLQKHLEHEKKQVDARSKQMDDKDKNFATKAEADAADAYFSEQCQALNITQAEQDKAVEIIKSANLDLSKLKPKDIADLALNYIQNTERKYTRMENAIDKVDPALRNDESFWKALSSLVDVSLTESDIEEIIRGYTGKVVSPNRQASSAPATSSESVSSDDSKETAIQKLSFKTPMKEEKQNVGNGANSKVYMSINDIFDDYN